jgi:RNA polymerase subunit RPABC4/transcription elongation factor Spt4
MDFVSCPRCQEMSPPDAAKCPACGASMDEEPVEVAPLGLAVEPEEEPGEEVAAAPPGAAVLPPLPEADAAESTGLASAHAVPVSPDMPAEAVALERQIAARPDAKGLYIKLADLHQRAGRKDAAIGVLERLLGVDPANALAKHRIDILRGTVRHAPPVAAVPPVARPARPAARRGGRSSRRGLWIGLGALAVVLVAVGLWLLSGPSRLVAGRGPVFSPGGDRIAFFTEAKDGATLNVYELGSGRSRALGPASAFGGDGDRVAWSPNGRQLAYVAPAGGGMGEEAVFVADVETGSTRELATGSSPSWSPDGQSVAMFCHERPRITATTSTEEGDIPTEFGDGWDGVCVVTAADGIARRLHEGVGTRLAFSPRAQTLVLERFPEEFPETAAAGAASGGDELQDLADEALKGGATNFYEGSRDLGRAIEARGLDKPRAGGVGSVFGDLWAIDADSGAVTTLSSDGRSSNPRWTADGRIVYVHQPQEAPGAELWVMSADGSGKQPLVRAKVALFDPAAVGVGGERVVYAGPVTDVNPGLAQVMTGEAAADLYLVRPGDDTPRRLKNRHTFKQRFTLSPDGRRVVYEANDPGSGQSELWLMKP